MDQISTLSRTASFELFGADDGTAAVPGNAPTEDIEIQVVSTIYSCAIVDSATKFPSSSLPTVGAVASSTTNGETSTPTQSSKTTATRSAATGHSPSSTGTSQSSGVRVQVSSSKVSMIILALVAGFAYTT